MFKLKRKKGQGAIEYLFMIAAALVIILIAVRYVGNTGNQAQEQGNLAQLQSQVELTKSNLISQYGSWSEVRNLKLYDSSGNQIGTSTFGDFYDLCMYNNATVKVGSNNINQVQACEYITNSTIKK